MRKTMPSSIARALFLILLCLMLQKPTQAIKQSYIIYMGSHSYGPSPTSLDIESITNAHYSLLGSYVGSTEKAKEAIFYSYSRYFNGFAAVLDEDEAAMVAKHPNVVSIFLNKARILHTTHSWDFLGLERNGVISNSSIWSKSLGEDIIIANLDTGVWPESKSFSDEGMGPVPSKWRGICEVDKNNTDNFYCNRKLIGARCFYKAYKAVADNYKNISTSYNSARDFRGHGSHTLSTAGGNFVSGANIHGNGNGTASGGSPKARVVAYKVCWDYLPTSGSCYDADILAAFEAAISDGVDVLSVSLGDNEPRDYLESGISIGSFHAVANGIVVVSSAGNTGPSPSTVINSEPWVITVAASTVDRDFTNYVTLGNNKLLKGASLSGQELPPHKLYPLITAVDAKADHASAEDANLCMDGTLDPQKTKEKIVVCVRGQNLLPDKGMEAARAGAVGMILANDETSGNDIQAFTSLIPVSHVTFTDASYIFNYINTTKSPVAYISKVETELGIKPAPIMAAFSSRGPNLLDPSLLKPDITAPGVYIIAAFNDAEATTLQASNNNNIEVTDVTPFVVMSGTSMSCPHVSGLVGLLKSHHPDWSPAAIKSAIMTTAIIIDNTGRQMMDSSREKATPFAYGAGHIQPNRAVDPGLVYDINVTDYLNFLCGRGYTRSQVDVFYEKPYPCPKSFSLVDFNYPAITVPNAEIGHPINVTRTLTNVGSPGKYSVKIHAPRELLVLVEPNALIFKEKGEKKMFRVTLTLKPQTNMTTDYVFGRLDWTDGYHHVRSPIVVYSSKF